MPRDRSRSVWLSGFHPEARLTQGQRESFQFLVEQGSVRHTQVTHRRELAAFVEHAGIEGPGMLRSMDATTLADRIVAFGISERQKHRANNTETSAFAPPSQGPRCLGTVLRRALPDAFRLLSIPSLTRRMRVGAPGPPRDCRSRLRQPIADILAQEEFQAGGTTVITLLTDVYRCAARSQVCVAEARDLWHCLALHGIDRWETLATFDGPGLIAAVRTMVDAPHHWDYDRCCRAHRVLHLARANPLLDGDGSYARLHHRVPVSFLAVSTTINKNTLALENPINPNHDMQPSVSRAWMAELPPSLLHFIQTRADPAELEHCLGIAACVLRDRLATNAGGRDRVRVVASCAATLLRVFRVIDRLESGSACFREWLPRTATVTHLTSVTARCMAFLNRHVAGRSQSTTHRIRTQSEVMLQHMMVLVRCGVFEPQTPVGAVLSIRQLHAIMFKLENEAPDRYAATPGPRALLSKPELTHDTFIRLCGAARTKAEAAYLQLSATTGLRAGAIARLQLAAVWDKPRSVVASVICASEKNSDVRRISTDAFPTLRAALSDYICSNERQAWGGGPYLFPNRHCATVPARGFAAVTLRRLCRRAGLPVHHHHQWRRMIVNAHMQRNGRLEDVAKWLGHRSPAITFDHGSCNDHLGRCLIASSVHPIITGPTLP